MSRAVLDALLANPATSHWLRQAIKSGRDRDLLDLLNDLDVMREAVRAQFDAAVHEICAAMERA